MTNELKTNSCSKGVDQNRKYWMDKEKYRLAYGRYIKQPLLMGWETGCLDEITLVTGMETYTFVRPEIWITIMHSLNRNRFFNGWVGGRKEQYFAFNYQVPGQKTYSLFICGWQYGFIYLPLNFQWPVQNTYHVPFELGGCNIDLNIMLPPVT